MQARPAPWCFSFLLGARVSQEHQPGGSRSCGVLVCTLLSEVCAPFHSWGAEAGPGSHPGKGVRETKATALPWP